MEMLLWAVGFALLGGIIYMLIGLVSGTDETAVLVPGTIIIILLGVPPVAVFSFFIAAVMSKHMTHAIPTTLLGVPGDTLAIPMMDYANMMRRLGVPHIALRKMISGSVLGAVIAVPVAVGFAALIAPLGNLIEPWIPIVFLLMAVFIAYTSSGKWASLFALVPFMVLLQALTRMASEAEHPISIGVFMGIAIGPMIADVLTVLSPVARDKLIREGKRAFWLAPENKSWKGWFPNPLRILSGRQIRNISIGSFISSLTFTFSPVGMTVIVGEFIHNRVKGTYQKLTSTLSAMNAVAESTYIAELIIPLIAFGIPLSPMAMGPGQALFNCPPVFSLENNLHHMMSTGDFLFYGMIGVVVAALVAYPFSMNLARKAAAVALKHVSQEAIISMFFGLMVVVAFYEGGIVGALTSITIGMICGVFNRYFGVGVGVQFMSWYASSWVILQIFGI